jgi:hypothetical protein
MPTISIDRKDFQALLGPLSHDPHLTNPQIESWLQLVKGELKDHDQDTGELRIELYRIAIGPICGPAKASHGKSARSSPARCPATHVSAPGVSRPVASPSRRTFTW